MEKRERFFKDGKPTDAFKRKSSFFELTILSDGSASYRPRRGLMEEAIQNLREESERKAAERRVHISSFTPVK